MHNKTSLLALMIILLAGAPGTYCQNSRIAGYKGLWFNAGQMQEYGYRFSGGSATFGTQHRPVAIYSPEARKTFFVYGGTISYDERHLLIMISYFDHVNHKVPKPVIVYDKMGVREPYDNPSLSIDPEGYLWVFISGRERIRPGIIYKSSSPYSIENFEEVTRFEMLAPQPWWIQNEGFGLFFIKKLESPELYFSYSNDGKIWDESQKIVSMGGHVHVSQAAPNKLAVVFNYYPEGNIDKQTNLYYIQTGDMGHTWKAVDGKTIDIPLIDPANTALIRNFESERKLVYICDLNFDQEGNPVILAILSNSSIPGPEGGPREWIIIRWKDQKWDFIKLCESDHNYDKGSLFITNNNWSVIGPSEPGPQEYRTGGEIVQWLSTDGGDSWKKVSDVTLSSEYNQSFVKRPLNLNRDFFAFWTDGDAEKLSQSHLYFTDQKCKKVWMLPYKMISDLEKPVRIR